MAVVIKLRTAANRRGASQKVLKEHTYGNQAEKVVEIVKKIV